MQQAPDWSKVLRRAGPAEPEDSLAPLLRKADLRPEVALWPRGLSGLYSLPEQAHPRSASLLWGQPQAAPGSATDRSWRRGCSPRREVCIRRQREQNLRGLRALG